MCDCAQEGSPAGHTEHQQRRPYRGQTRGGQLPEPRPTLTPHGRCCGAELGALRPAEGALGPSPPRLEPGCAVTERVRAPPARPLKRERRRQRRLRGRAAVRGAARGQPPGCGRGVCQAGVSCWEVLL